MLKLVDHGLAVVSVLKIRSGMRSKRSNWQAGDLKKLNKIKKTRETWHDK